MTTFASTQTRTTSWPMFAALGIGVSLVLTAVGTFADLTGNEPGSESHLAEYLTVAGIVVVAAAVVFGLVVRTVTAENAGRRALVLAVLGLASLVIFWAGLPAVLAAGAFSCALTARPRSAAARSAMALSLVSVALAVLAAVMG